MKTVLDKYTNTRERSGVKPRHLQSSMTHVKLNKRHVQDASRPSGILEVERESARTSLTYEEGDQVRVALPPGPREEGEKGRIQFSTFIRKP
jgi:hypothetical protein